MNRRRRWSGALLTLGLLAAAAPAYAAGTAAQRTWNFDQVKVPQARSEGRLGSGVTVAVLDSWVDAAHRDFEGRVLPGADCLGGSCKDGPATPDKCDHGTHVAGTVASSSFGVAPKARILPIRVLTYDAESGSCVGRPDDVAAGIRWAASHGARVMNLSLGPDVPGLSSSTAIPAAVSEAASQGIVIVFSAGNASLPVTDSYGTDALIVAATGRSGQLAAYSQRGNGVDLAAPGGDPKSRDACTQPDCITSLYPGNRYAVAAGTSMAAPHIAGIAALLLGQQPGRTREQVMARMQDTARPLAQAGSGLVDAAAALGVKATTASPKSSPEPAPVPVIRPQSAAPRPPSKAPAPRRTPTTPKPSPTAAVGASPSPIPRIVTSSPPVSPPPSQAQPLPTEKEALPLSLTLLAAGLIVASGGSVAAFGRPRRP